MVLLWERADPQNEPNSPLTKRVSLATFAFKAGSCGFLDANGNSEAVVANRFLRSLIGDEIDIILIVVNSR